MRGRARTLAGQEVNVHFSLALARASFDLEFSIDGNYSTAAVVDVKKVAFQAALSASGSFKNTIVKNTKKKVAKSADLVASVRAGPENGAAKFSSGGSISANMEANQTKNSTYTVNFPVSNIKVTNAGNRINWEIYPKVTVDDLSHSGFTAYLDGEMFPSGEKSEVNCACFVKKKADFRNSSLVVAGYVSTSLRDMIIGDIEFTDDLGSEVDWRTIKNESGDNKSLAQSVFRSDDVKKSLLKSIVRKHLIAQGMSANGPCVEISKAYT